MMLILLLISVLIPVDDVPKELTGKVVSIADGDTITILTAEKKQVKIRFNGIDAPERGQPFGTKSKEFLSHLVGEKSVRIVTHGKDRYGRTIGEVFVRLEKSAASDPDGNVNVMLVANGFAWHYVQYAPDSKELAAAEQQARELKLGLWADPGAVAPWEWRKQESEKRKAKK